jgi:glycosyltransferase involved in cell wall biosynthesis
VADLLTAPSLSDVGPVPGIVSSELLGNSASTPNAPLRIMYVIGTLETGGAELQLLELLRRIDRSRFSVSLALFAASGRERARGLADEVIDLGIPSTNGGPWRPRGFHVTRAMHRLARYIRRSRPSVVHAILPGACMVGCPAAKLAGAPVVIGSRRSLTAAYRGVSPLKAAMDRAALLFSDYMVGNSRPVTNEITWQDGFPRAKTMTIHNGVDTDRFSPSTDRSLRRELGFNEGHVVLGTVANFFAYKRHIDLVRAAALLCPEFPELRFLAVGEDRGTLPQIRRAIAEAGLEDRFVLIPGSESPERVFAAMDVYVCTSETEGFSNVLLEAMAAGKPMIATNVGGNPEAVAKGVTGLLVPRHAPQALADAAQILLTSPKLRREMGIAARERALELFSIEKMVRSYEDFYSAVVARTTG